ncbi:F-box protein [Trifolium pratense]|uniref:F-box protein n=1 Tax=Trifolium pratense TaxID=57577 RepID=A0A2K3N079_TRIPR|nr:F-box protein [Trifolium pratense]
MNLFRNNLLSKSHPHYHDSGLVLNQFMGLHDWNIYLISGDKFENKVKLNSPPIFQIPNIGVTPIRVLGSAINGILCIYDDYGTFPKTTVLWNPATEEIIEIPIGHAEIKPEFTTLVFPHGFGYDDVGDDYKIIQHVDYIMANENPLEDLEDVMIPDPFWEIYSLKSNSWRKIDFDMPIISWIFNSIVYFDGVCHWLGETNMVVSFQLCNEVYFITPCPFEEDTHDKEFEVNLTVLNESVAIITNCNNTTFFQVFILGEFGVEESWIRLFDVELMSCMEQPIGAGKKGNIFFIKEDGELACFDLTTGLIEDIGIQGEKNWCQIAIYKKNLCLI